MSRDAEIQEARQGVERYEALVEGVKGALQELNRTGRPHLVPTMTIVLADAESQLAIHREDLALLVASDPDAVENDNRA